VWLLVCFEAERVLEKFTALATLNKDPRRANEDRLNDELTEASPKVERAPFTTSTWTH
jgi:hypothetical protein